MDQANNAASQLQAQDFRLIRRGVAFYWTHPAEVKADDLDCTDMDDEQFERVVMEVAA